MAARIEDYALVGDGETAALVSRMGSVDWLCWPRFDSAACFAALLGKHEHGRWQIAPAHEPHRITRRYIPGTLVLETEMEAAGGRIRLTDFMPPRGGASDLIRIVTGLEGRVSMQTELIIRFEYGAVIPWVTQEHGDQTELHAVAGPDMLTLRTPVRLRGEGGRTVGKFEISARERIAFVMTHSPSHRDPPSSTDVDAALEDTLGYWRAWSGKCQYSGPWREAVERSLITLKALIYAPTGGIVAAATTSLPESLGGVRNWDYRYCWLRDATFTLLSLMNAGYLEEAQAWRAWLVRALAGSPAQAQIMYGVGGERRLTEWEVSWLPGFERSCPVRVGNAAAKQQQLDVYGEIADALHHARGAGLKSGATDWAVQCALTEHLEQIWREPDQGIWESRGPAQPFTSSKVMAWVAFDRAIKSIEAYGLPGPLEKWRELRARIHEDVCTNAFSTRLGSFVQAAGSESLDASLLLIPLVGFLPAHDERMRGTLAAVEKHLKVDGLVRRYHTAETDDGLPRGEGAFLACSFWYLDNLTLVGRHAEARELFEELLKLRNDVGLLAEEYDPRIARQLGNFPQAFSHVALIGSAFNLNGGGHARPAQQRGSHQVSNLA